MQKYKKKRIPRDKIPNPAKILPATTKPNPTETPSHSPKTSAAHANIKGPNAAPKAQNPKKKSKRPTSQTHKGRPGIADKIDPILVERLEFAMDQLSLGYRPASVVVQLKQKYGLKDYKNAYKYVNQAKLELYELGQMRRDQIVGNLIRRTSMIAKRSTAYMPPREVTDAEGRIVKKVYPKPDFGAGVRATELEARLTGSFAEKQTSDPLQNLSAEDLRKRADELRQLREQSLRAA